MAKKERKLFREEIEIPDGINVNVEGEELIMKKEDKELVRKINPLLSLKSKDKKIIVKCKRSTKRDKKVFGTMKAHIKNMIKGLEEGFNYKLQAVSVHFPMTVDYNKDSNEVIVKNFLGEKTDRKIRMVDNVDIKVNKDVIEISSSNIENAGQAAANLEKGTKVRNKDRRIYQDGIFIVEKPGRIFK
jgi:large subunit ribosomal protein L6